MCAAHLFTHRNFYGTLGLAYIGTLCTKENTGFHSSYGVPQVLIVELMAWEDCNLLQFLFAKLLLYSITQFRCPTRSWRRYHQLTHLSSCTRIHARWARRTHTHAHAHSTPAHISLRSLYTSSLCSTCLFIPSGYSTYHAVARAGS